MSARPGSARPDPAAEIPRRRLDFDFDPDAVPRDFYAGDPALSSVLAALSIAFPEGERFFVESVAHFRDRIDDPTLADAVKGFAAQEGMHSKEHAAFNAMLRAQGLEVTVDLERRVRSLLRIRRKTAAPAGRLAVTCALEHFTAVMAEQVLTDEAHRDEFHPSIRPLWVWHALEELEHKAVAFDVYEKVDGSYFRRVRAMLLTTLFFTGFVSYAHVRLLAARGRLGDARGLLRALNHMWLWPGVFRRLVPAYLSYYRPGFHPNGRDTTGLVREWRERLFGERGELRGKLRPADPATSHAA
jgi:hypothetical protein